MAMNEIYVFLFLFSLSFYSLVTTFQESGECLMNDQVRRQRTATMAVVTQRMVPILLSASKMAS